MTYERQFFQYLENIQRRIYTQPLNLGGVSSSGGGVGGPPGGFIGYLPQSKVTYDKLEAATHQTVSSGPSLLDNLNHIRKRLETVEVSGVFYNDFTIQENDIEKVAGATILNFEGNITVTDEGGNKATITISGGSDANAIHDNIANEITAITPKISLVANDEFIIEDSEVSYVKKAVTFANLESSLTHTDINAIHDNVGGEINAISEKTSTVAADIVIIEDSATSYTKKKVKLENLLASGSGGGSIEVQEDDAQKVTNATILNFEGNAVVTDEGGGKATITISGSSGGSADFTYWSPDAPPASASSYDDEFEDSSFDTGLWTEFDNDSELIVTEDQAGLLLDPTAASDIMGIYQSKPATYLSVVTKVAITGTYESASEVKAGIIIYEDAASNPTTCDLITFAVNTTNTGISLMVEHWDDYNTHNTTIFNKQLDIPSSTSFYLRARTYQIVINNYVAFDYSTDGLSWIILDSIDTSSYFTPDEIGVFLKSASPNHSARFPFFRVVTGSASTYLNPNYLVEGDRINGYRAA